MAFHVRDAETDRVVRELAGVTGQSITTAIREACTQALAEATEEERQRARRARMKEIRERIAAYPDTGEKTDKAFFDSLNDE